MHVPLVIGLRLALLADAAIRQEVVEKLNRKHIDRVQIFERGDVDVLTLGDVEEHAVNKK